MTTILKKGYFLCILCICGISIVSSSCHITNHDISTSPTSSPYITESPSSPFTDEPMPTNTEAPHDWIGNGYSYSSDTLGITVEFPPNWNEYVNIFESKSYENFLDNSSEPIDCIYIVSKKSGLSKDSFSSSSDYDSVIAEIYWCPAGAKGPEASFGECITMGSKNDGSLCLCHLPLTGKMGLEQVDVDLWNVYTTVENGILSGEYQFEIQEQM